MTKIHLDTDLGGDIDDLCALAMLLKWPDVEITGITSTAEENGRRAGYTKYVLQLAGREDIPVAAGADVSLDCYRVKPDYPPDEELWPEKIHPSPNPVDEALELLKHSIEQKAIIIAIGPFTNLFLLDQKYPGILRDARMYLMGGYIYPSRQGFPQWESSMDYNVQLDIASAQYIIERYDPVLVPLTVTGETALRRAYLEELRKSGPVGALLARQAEAIGRIENNEEKIGKTNEGLPDDFLNFQHDPLACAVALGWDGAKISEIRLSLTVKDEWLYEIPARKGKLTHVVTKVDGDRFNTFWLETVTQL